MRGLTCVLCFLSWCQRWWGACRVSYLLIKHKRKLQCLFFKMYFRMCDMRVKTLKNHSTSSSQLPVCVYRAELEQKRVVMNTCVSNYYSEVMRYVPSPRLRFMDHRTLIQKYIYSVQVCGELLSDTAPCCTSPCWQTHRWWWSPTPLLFSWAVWRGRFHCWEPRTLIWI